MACHAHHNSVDASTPPVSPSATAIPVAERQEAPPPPPSPNANGTHQPNLNATVHSHVNESDESDHGTKSSRTSARLRQRRKAGDTPDPVMNNTTLNSESNDED